MTEDAVIESVRIDKEDNTYSYSSKEYEKNRVVRRASVFRFKPIIFSILIFELCERLCFYSIQGNFVAFCKIHLSVDNVTALKLSLIFTGVIYMMCVLGGWLSDSVYGRFRMILISGFMYFLGVLLLTSVPFPYDKYISSNIHLTLIQRRTISGFGLFFIAFGTGGIKTVVGPFGAQQLDQSDPNLTRLYFIWLYWFVNIGSSIAFTGVAYVQQEHGFFWGFLIPLSSIFLAMVIFLLPVKYYQMENVTNNGMSDYLGIVIEAFQRRSKSVYRYNTLMDYSRLSNGGSYDDETIDGLTRIKRILPVLLTFIPFYIAYAQMQSSYFTQGEHLNLNISQFTVPVASLNIINNIVIIVVIPLMAVIIYPIIQYCCGRTPSPLQRIGFGLFLASLSVLTAGCLEIIRKKDLNLNGGIPQTVFNSHFNVSQISVLAQIPQFFFVGSGEVFAAATGLEFSYSQAPVSQRSLVSGLFYFMLGAGSFLGSALIELVNLNSKYPWMPNDIDSGHYEYFYFLLFGIVIADILIFIFIARSYRYVENGDEFDEERRLIVRYLRESNNDEDDNKE